MDNFVDELLRIATRCERAARTMTEGPINDMRVRLLNASAEVGRAASGSWIDYQAKLYLNGFRLPAPGEHFNKEWGFVGAPSNTTRGPWREYEYDEVHEAILSRARVKDLAPIQEAAEAAAETFERCKDELVPSIDAALADGDDKVLSEARQKLTELRNHVTARDYVETLIPRGEQLIRDPRAQAGAGFRTPHHIQFEARFLEFFSCAYQLNELAKIARYVATYLQKRMGMKGNTIAKKRGKVFIGHGRSAVWRDLKDFLYERLRLDVDEFNREPTAGKSTKERLGEMLDSAVFAFLVMTAEDEHADGTKHARGNVIHETGLFQGRLGFERAIILLEAGCEEFSNIIGLTQIRFPKGNLRAVSEEIRRVLEREGIIE